MAQDKPLMLIIGTTMIFNLFGMEYLYKALERYTYISVRSILFKFAALILMFFMVHSQEDFVIYGGISVFATVGSNLMNFINLRKHVLFNVPGPYEYRKHFKPIAVFFSMAIAVSIYTSLDKAMLGFMKSDTEVGYYDAAVKIKTIVLSLVTSVGAVMLPRVSYYIERNYQEEFRRLTAKAFNFVLLMALPVSIFFVFMSKDSILFLADSQYMGSVLPMQIIMPTVVLIGATNIMGIQMLVPLGREKMVLYSEIAGAIVNLILNIILIPRMASAGAAIGTLFAELVVLSVQTYAIRDMLGFLVKGIRWLNLILASAVATAALWFALGIHYANSFLALAGNAVFFFGAYGVILLIMREPLVLQILSDTKRAVEKVVKKR
jgi:O-antigen/teichoic acid export membrane protein